MSSPEIFSLPGTAVATSGVKMFSQAMVPGIFKVEGLAGSETVKLQMIKADIVTFEDVTDENGAVQMTATKNTLPLNVPGRYKLSKSITVSAVVKVTLSFGTSV